jgi:hypothetical protein
MENIFWVGYSNYERSQSIIDIERIINSLGYITDFKHYSDLAISITIEIEEHKIDILYKKLKNSIMMDAFDCLNSIADTERTIFLNVSFLTGHGDLKIEVPAVPG